MTHLQPLEIIEHDTVEDTILSLQKPNLANQDEQRINVPPLMLNSPKQASAARFQQLGSDSVMPKAVTPVPHVNDTQPLVKKSARTSLQFNSLELDLVTLVKNCTARCISLVGSQLWLVETNGILSVRDPLRFGKIDGRPILWQNGEWKFNIQEVQTLHKLSAQQSAQQLAMSQRAAQMEQQGSPMQESVPVVRQSQAYISKCCWDPIQRTVWMCATDGSIQIFNATKKHDQNFRLLRVRIDGWQSHEGLITDIKFIPSKQVMVTCGLDGQVKFWNTINFDLIHVSYLGDWYLHSLEVDNRGFVWVSSENGHIYVFKLKSASEVAMLNDLNIIAMRKLSTTGSAEEDRVMEAFARKNPRRNATGLCALCFDAQQENMWVAGKNGFIYIIRTKAIQGGSMNFKQLQKVVKRFPYPPRLHDRGVIHQMVYVPRKLNPLICMVCADTLVFFNAEMQKHVKTVRVKEGGFITSMTLLPRFVPQTSTETLDAYRITQDALTTVRQQSSKEGHLIHLIARLWICQNNEMRELLIQEAQSPSRDDINVHDTDYEEKNFIVDEENDKSVKSNNQRRQSIIDENASKMYSDADATGPIDAQEINYNLLQDVREVFGTEYDYLNKVILRKCDQKRNVKVDTSELFFVNDSWTQTKRSKRKRAIPVETCSQTDITGEIPEENVTKVDTDVQREVSLTDKVLYDMNQEESGVMQSAILTTHVRALHEVDLAEHQRLRAAYEKLLLEKEREMALQNDSKEGCVVM